MGLNIKLRQKYSELMSTPRPPGNKQFDLEFSGDSADEENSEQYRTESRTKPLYAFCSCYAGQRTTELLDNLNYQFDRHTKWRM